MSPSLKVISPLVYPEWDRLIATNPSNSFFHTSGWAKVLAETYDYTPIYFSVVEGKLFSLLPFMEIRSRLTGTRGVSLPFSDYAAPILQSDLDPQEAINGVSRYGKAAGWKYLEIRNVVGLRDDIHPYEVFFQHTLELSNDEDIVFSRFRDSTIRNIKKATKEGVTVHRYESLDAVNEFYRLNCITRREHGIPPQPHDFFRKLHEHVISKGNGFVMLARYRDKYVAGAVYLHFGNKCLYKYGASDKKYQHLRANNLVMWEAIKWYCRNGHEQFCFGRTDPMNKGLMQFKAGWGTTERLMRYYRYDVRSSRYLQCDSNGAKRLNQFFRGLPLPALRLAGNLLYRHIG